MWNMPRLPDVLRVVLTVAGRPISGLLVRVAIAPTRKNAFVSYHGPSDETGTVIVTRNDILRKAEQTLSLGLMDYGGPESDAAGSLHVAPLDRQAIAKALVGYEQYKRYTVFDTGYRDHLVKADQVLVGLANARVDARATWQGGDMLVECGFTRP
jgi:hypothetical protein